MTWNDLRCAVCQNLCGEETDSQRELLECVMLAVAEVHGMPLCAEHSVQAVLEA